MFIFFIHREGKDDPSETKLQMALTHSEALRLILAELEERGIGEDKYSSVSNRLYRARVEGKSIALLFGENYDTLLTIRYVFAGKASTRMQDYFAFRAERMARLTGFLDRLLVKQADMRVFSAQVFPVSEFPDSEDSKDPGLGVARLHRFHHQTHPYRFVSAQGLKKSINGKLTPFDYFKLEFLSEIIDSMEEMLEMQPVSMRYERECDYFKSSVVNAAKELVTIAPPPLAKQAEGLAKDLDSKNLREVCQVYDNLATLHQLPAPAGVELFF